MSVPAIDSVWLRYAASLGAVLALVLVGIGVTLALPETMPYREPAIWTVGVTVFAVAIEAMGRIETGESPVGERLRRLR